MKNSRTLHSAAVLGSSGTRRTLNTRSWSKIHAHAEDTKEMQQLKEDSALANVVMQHERVFSRPRYLDRSGCVNTKK
jgi:hypothetical protein